MNKKNNLKVAVIGATGIVGRELIEILAQRKFPTKSLSLFASKNSMGEVFSFKGESLIVKELLEINDIDSDTDIAFFAVSAKIAKKFVEPLSKKGVFCIDKSSAFREKENAKLIVPEVNAELLKNFHTRIIASPNCIAVPLVQVLKPLHDAFGLLKVLVSTYQAVSGAGKEGSDELESQVRDLFNFKKPAINIFDKRIAFNLLSFINEEEEKVINETKKILKLPNLLMDVTCVRVPIFNGHSMAVNLSFENPSNISQVMKLLSQLPHIKLVDEPTPLEASGKDETYVGRIRLNGALKNGLSLFICSDNLRTGAALNAVKIAETIFTQKDL